MADRLVPLVTIGLATALVGLIVVPVLAVAWNAGGFGLRSADLAAVRFTILQALLSAVISVVLAVPLAKALARRRFVGRAVLISLMGAPFLLPVIVAVLGLLAIFGRAGVVNTAMAAMDLPALSIYGLQGVVLAHVFLNLPLATRMVLQAWQSVPSERLQLARSLDFAPADIARHIERPLLRAVLPGAALVIFVICLTSFSIALTLGGGPRATTLELAIYQAMRFDFDLGHAAGLALLQLVIGGFAMVLAWRATKDAGFGAGADRRVVMSSPNGWRSVCDTVLIVAAATFLAAPLIAILVAGVSGLPDLPQSVWPAALRSVSVAVVSATLAVTLALTLALASASRAKSGWLFETAALLPLATSALVLGVGLFLILQPFISPARLALPVTVVVNAALSLPFIYRLILPDARSMAADFGRLADSLDLHGLARLRWLVLPRLSRPLGFGAGVAAALSAGDLGVIALFAGESQATLPLVVQRLMGAYQMQAAMAAALVLVAISLMLFWLCDWVGRHAAA